MLSALKYAKTKKHRKITLLFKPWCLQLTQPVFSNTINFTDSRTYEPVDHSDCSLIKWEGQPP